MMAAGFGSLGVLYVRKYVLLFLYMAEVTYQEYIDLLGKIFEYDNLSSNKDSGESKYRFAQWLLLNLKK